MLFERCYRGTQESFPMANFKFRALSLRRKKRCTRQVVCWKQLGRRLVYSSFVTVGLFLYLYQTSDFFANLALHPTFFLGTGGLSVRHLKTLNASGLFLCQGGKAGFLFSESTFTSNCNIDRSLRQDAKCVRKVQRPVRLRLPLETCAYLRDRLENNS